MKKVAMYSTNQLFGSRPTGGTKRFLELYYGLVNKGINVDLYSTDSSQVFIENNIVGYSLIGKEQSNNIFIPTELKILLSNINIIKKIKQEHYNRIIVFDVPTAIGLCLMGVKHVQLFIRQDLIGYKKISVGGRTDDKLTISLYLLFMRLCETICLLRAERVIIQCEYDYNVLLERHRFIKNTIKQKSTIQINNANPAWIIDKSNEASKMSIIALKDNTTEHYIVGFVGDFRGERKGHKIFIDAIKGLIDMGLAVEAAIVGDGEQLSKHKDECKGYENIKFFGRLENPLSVMQSCDLMVVPSLADSCPNTVMEALYNEVPVIGAMSGGIPEILIDRESLFLPNIQSLKERIMYFLDENNLKNLGKKQKLRKRELSFDWSEAMMKHLDL